MKKQVLALHRQIVAIPSVSGNEHSLVAFLADYLESRGAAVLVLERNLIVWSPENPHPQLVFNSHLDTVPANSAWTRDAYDLGDEDDRTFGLGSNDAKASVAAMVGSFLQMMKVDSSQAWGLTLVCDEETGGRGSELVIPHLQTLGWPVQGIVVGEPTNLEIATSQKGLLILKLKSEGLACHSANAGALGAKNAIVELAQDIVTIRALEIGSCHQHLGPTTVEPTLIDAGGARNTLPAHATCLLDIRTSPGLSHEDVIEVVQNAVQSEIIVVSKRLRSRACPPAAKVLAAAMEAAPQSRCYGSPTMSDWAYCGDIPAIKCGPGQSARSHQGDEFVLKSEILDGLEFYLALGRNFIGGDHHESTLEQG